MFTFPRYLSRREGRGMKTILIGDDFPPAKNSRQGKVGRIFQATGLA
jgi:hypothetical protein